jgi:hypothetical protein
MFRHITQQLRDFEAEFEIKLPPTFSRFLLKKEEGLLAIRTR